MIPPIDFLIRFLCFSVCHSLLASDRLKLMVKKHLPGSTTWYRLSYNILSLGLLGWVMAGWSTAPVLYIVPGTWYLILRGCQLLLLIATVRCVMQTGLCDFLGFSCSSTSSPLITTGCYARVRHPLYTLTILFLLLEPAPSSKWLLFTLLSGIYCVLASRWEEQRLLQHYGNSYGVYQQAVSAFIPRWWLQRK